MPPQPTPTSSTADSGTHRAAAKPSKSTGYTNMPIVSQRPRRMVCPRAAIISAPSERADAARRLEQAIGGGVAVQHVHRPGGQQRRIGHAEQGRDRRDGDQDPQQRMRDRIAHPFAQLREAPSACAEPAELAGSRISTSAMITAMNDTPLSAKHHAAPKAA